MRLLDTSTAEFRWVNEPRHVSYAILSHVWMKEGEGPAEQSYQDVKKILKQSNRLKLWPTNRKRHSIPRGVSEKIRRCCAIAREHGFDSVWVDSSCIDKTSSSELSEAINSMFKWYQHAGVCYAYLYDVDDDDEPRAPNSQFRRSRWFSRGWTLQELLAPRVLVFISKGWRVLGTKAILATVIEDVTGIERAILTHEASLDSVSVARRISWASRRQTTREEDEAYSLMGILGIHLPTIYGEGRFAFIRLQEEVLKQTSDQSLFVWGLSLQDEVELVDVPSADGAYFWEEREKMAEESLYMRNLFALSPRDFVSSAQTLVLPRHTFVQRLRTILPLSDYTATSHGIRMTVPVLTTSSVHSDVPVHLAILACQDSTGRSLALILRNQDHTSNEFIVGAFLAPTMTISDNDIHGRDLSANGQFSLGELYFRTTRLTQDFLAAHRDSIRVQEIYVPHRPSQARARALPAYGEVQTALTRCDGAFDIQLTGWCQSLLEKDGYVVSPIWYDQAIDLDYPRRRGYELRKSGRCIHIELGVCGCEEGVKNRWLRAVVTAHLAPANPQEPKASVQTDWQRPLAVRHTRRDADHVSSWHFASKFASKQFHVYFGTGQGLTVQLNLSVVSSERASHSCRTYALGVEMFHSESPSAEITPLATASSKRWSPPFVVVDPSSSITV
ncbi:heterokaryon incompatibility protein-domain-containing protein [Dichomitus squalens]|uniref:Heterokaryon incompatibility protein-domain-containing protein n=1 Tax=Dichomitus squalens TaxID=114155 RepID=A0A4Q9Q2S1_9APHY|nr:heterokaryon incompatibility protein-domain-containing protein [Dichomitus squalens]